MTDDAFTSPNRVIPQRVPRPGELLLEFVRASDRAPISGELREHGPSWEVQFLERGELPLYARGGVTLLALAVKVGEAERKATEKGGA